MAGRSAAKPTLRVVKEDERPSLRERVRAWRAARTARRRRRRDRRQPMPRTVVVMLAAAFLLTGIGLVMVLSASSVSSAIEYGTSFLFLKRQAVYAAIGTVALIATARISYRRWQAFSPVLLVLSVVLMGLALHPSIGSTRGGSARWIELGPVTFQPSELAKLAMVMFAATILTRKWKRLDDPAHLAIPLLPAVLAVCGLIVLQRDLGTTTIVVVTTFVMLFAAGVRLRYLAVTALTGAVMGWGLIMVEGYRKARLLSFLHPGADPMNTGYQLIQSLIGLGSGGWFGVGLGASRQKWMWLPNAHTDFIFSILGEELGLIGEIVVLVLFAVLVYTGIRIASRATDTFGRLLATGIVGWLAVQTLVNLGAVTGLLPVTGVPLPFVSFGGSSLIVTLAGVGILANIGRTAAREQASGRAPQAGAARVRRGRGTKTVRRPATPRGSAHVRGARTARQAPVRGGGSGGTPRRGTARSDAAREAARRGHPVGSARRGGPPQAGGSR